MKWSEGVKISLLCKIYKLTRILIFNMKTIYEPNIPRAWGALNEGEYAVGDRFERIGFFYFDGRAKEITPLPNGVITVTLVTLAEESLGGLGIQVMRLWQNGAECASWDSVKKDDPQYNELLAYSQKRDE
jgi:hypothetical protein